MTEYLRCPFEVKASGDAPGAFEGYGAVFGNEDSYGDVITKGAFAESLKEWKAKKKLPPMLLQHGGGFLGSASDLVPIGKWEAMSEDDHGLYVKGRLIAMETERTKQVYAAMQEGALDGLSIGYIPKGYALGTKPNEPERTLTKVALMEVSVVTFPANPEARVSAVKSIRDIHDVRALEAWLREVARLSKSDAREFINQVKSMLRCEAAGATDEPATRLARGLERALAALKGATSHVGDPGSGQAG